MDRDLEIIKGDHFPLEVLIENMREKKAKIKISREDISKGLNLNVLRVQGRAHLFMLYILLVKKKADDWNGILIREGKLSELAKHHIFPRNFLEEKLELEEPETKETLINNLANITFIHKDINSEIEDTPPEEYVSDYLDSARKHFIPTDKNMWLIEQYNTFLNYRIKQIYLAGKEVFSEIIECQGVRCYPSCLCPNAEPLPSSH